MTSASSMWALLMECGDVRGKTKGNSLLIGQKVCDPHHGGLSFSFICAELVMLLGSYSVIDPSVHPVSCDQPSGSLTALIPRCQDAFTRQTYTHQMANLLPYCFIFRSVLPELNVSLLYCLSDRLQFIHFSFYCQVWSRALASSLTLWRVMNVD